MTDQTEMGKRKAIASELADIVYRQNLITVADDVFIRDFPDEINEELANLLEQDKKDLALLETVQTNFGIRSEPKQSCTSLADFLMPMIADPSLTKRERLGAYALMRQQQLMCGHLLHKAGQKSEMDIKEALGPFLGVQSDFAKRIADVMTCMEDIAVREIVGEQPVQGMVGRLRDAGAALAGAVVGRMAKPIEEMNVLDVLRMDHTKVKAIFREMKDETSPQKLNGLYHQLRSDLLAHSLAEEEVVYDFFRMYDDIRERVEHAQSEHRELRLILDEMEEYSSISQEFTSRLRSLKEVVMEHVDEEEGEMFKLFKERASEDQLIELSAPFAGAKRRIQENLAGMARDDELDVFVSA